MNLDSVQPATLIPALRWLVHLLAEKDYRRLEDEGLIAESVVGPSWRQGGVAERTTPAEIEEVLARVGDRVASRTPLIWDQVTRIIFYNDYPDNRATLAPIPDDAFARAWTMVVTPEGKTTVLVPIDLYTATTLGPPLPAGVWWIALGLLTAEGGRSALNLHAIVSDDPARPVRLAYLSLCPLAPIAAIQDLVRALAAGDDTQSVAMGHGTEHAARAALEKRIIGYRDDVLSTRSPSGSGPPPHLIDLPVQAFRYADAQYVRPYLKRGRSRSWNIDVGLWWSDSAFPTGLTLHAYVSKDVATGGWRAWAMDVSVI